MDSSFLRLLVLAILAVLFHRGQAACRYNWVPYGNSCYIFSNAKASWFESVATCAANSGVLTDIRNVNENSWVISQVRNRHLGSIWIAGSDMFNEGTWLWLGNRTSIDAMDLWMTGQPDNFRGVEHCLEMAELYNYKWNDMDCSVRQSFVCKTKN